MASCPLFKRMRNKGTSFFAFPSSSNDMNIYPFQDDMDMFMSKFVLLNIPPSDADQIQKGKILNFTKTDNLDPLYPTNGVNMYNFDPNSSYPFKYSEQLVESIRNYIANQDAEFRETRISSNKDFYNPKEYQTPTEMIFWKWCKKNNILDLETAEHKIDWDKNLPDFDNPNASTVSNQDYFRKYLWKEREIRNYNCIINTDGSHAELYFNQITKFKIGDIVYITTGTTTIGSVDGDGILTGTTHTITDILFDYNVPSSTITLDLSWTDDGSYSGVCYLQYHKLVQYIGEIQYTSKVKAQQQFFTEFSAMIPSHAGQSPTVLFRTSANSNFYPGLEIPILDEQIQDEILGAENLASPIRTDPANYPGSYFGYFDTYDKTYKMSTGDPLRYSGNYSGVLRVNNVGLAPDDYVENLEEFNSNNIDGLGMDFNIKHYYKSQQPGKVVNNFDDFDGISIDGNPPLDFEFNAILWYYTIIDKTNNNQYTNLYGIEILDNPDNDFGTDDDRTITTTRKLVSNENQDGYSYIYNLNLDFKVDNDMLPLRYDPTSIYDAFSFDLYNNVMSNYVRLSEQYSNVMSEFININQEIVKLKSLLYSQTDINELKRRLSNMENLIKLYQTNQFADSESVKIRLDYTKNYPLIMFDAMQVDYNEIYNYTTNDISTYNLAKITQLNGTSDIASTTLTTVSYMVPVPESGKFLVNIYNDIIIPTITGLTLNISLDKDLSYKQSVDIIVRPDQSLYSNKMNLNVMFYDGTPNVRRETLLLGNIDTPADLTQSISGTTVFNNSYYYSLSTFVSSACPAIDVKLTIGSTVVVISGTTSVDIKTQLFSNHDWVYIEDFYFLSGGTTLVNYSGLYYISHIAGTQITINLNIDGLYLVLAGTPKIHYYKGVKISITRIDESNYSDINHRYLVNKEFITSELKGLY